MATTAQLAHQKKEFLKAFSACGVVTRACAASGAPRRSIYNWLQSDAAFATEYQEAEIQSIEVLESEMLRRGVEGVERPVYQQGRMVGTVREYSDTLLIFALKARAPDRYRENRHITLDGSLTLAQLVAEVAAGREGELQAPA
jgi:hypothetical protein